MVTKLLLQSILTSCLLTPNPFYFQWIPELKHYAPGVPIILVGTKLGKNDAVLNFEKSILLCL